MSPRFRLVLCRPIRHHTRALRASGSVQECHAHNFILKNISGVQHGLEKKFPDRSDTIQAAIQYIACSARIHLFHLPLQEKGIGSLYLEPSTKNGHHPILLMVVRTSEL